MSVWARPRDARKGESTRAKHHTYVVRWRLGGTREGAWQNVTVGNTKGHAAQAAALDAWVASQGGNVTKADALAWLTGTSSAGDEPEDAEPVPTVRTAVTEWIAKPSKRGKGESSRKAYRAVLSRLGDLGDLPATELTQRRVNAWFGAWEAKGSASATLHLSLVVLKGSCSAYCPADAFANIGYKVTRNVRVNVLTPEQTAALVTTARTMPDGMALPVWFLAELGVRWGEMAGVRAFDVDLANRTVRIERQAVAAGTRRSGAGFRTDTLKTPRSVRTLKMSAELTEALALVAELAPDAPVFAPPYAEWWTYDGWRRAWLRLKSEAGLPPETRTHDLRHTAAMRWLRAGVALPVVSRLLGHAHVGITDKAYSHYTAADLDAIVGAGLTL